MPESASDAPARMRIDKWLWCARFYKSRSQAGAAVAGGKVHVNGERVRPAHALKVGDRLELTHAATVRELTVVALAARRGPAAEAARCYEESSASLARRARLQEQHALAAAFAPRPEARPDKRERRHLMKLRRQE